MKTTTQTALANRIEKLVKAKELSKSSLVYKWVSAIQSNEVLRPVFSQGSTWKSSTLIDKTCELSSILNKLGIEFESGNDALRCGKTGCFVKIKTKIIKK